MLAAIAFRVISKIILYKYLFGKLLDYTFVQTKNKKQ